MKFKKTGAAIACAATLLFSACSISQPTQFNARWRKSVTDASENVDLGSAKELTEYKVSFEKGDNQAYSVDYSNGKYSTSLSTENGNYVYETSLSIDVSFTFNGETVKFSGENGDLITSKAIVKSTQNGLKPVSSVKKVAAHIPSSATPTELGDGKNSTNGCFRESFYTISTDYATKSCTIEYFTDNTFTTPHTVYKQQTRNFISDDNYSLIDNEALPLALRAMNKTSTLYVYNTAVGKVQNVSVTKSKEEKTTFDFVVLGSAGESSHDVSYAPYTVAINDVNPGSTQTFWVASTTDSQNNEFRNVILKMVTPLYFNLGTLVYELVSVDFLDD